MEKIKVINVSRTSVMINLSMLTGKTYPLKPNAFAFLTEDEISYIQNTSSAFKRGFLKIDESKPLPDTVEIVESKNALPEDEMEKFLSKTQKVIKHDLSEMDNMFVLKDLVAKAKELDKSVRVIDMIESRIEELIGQEG